MGSTFIVIRLGKLSVLNGIVIADLGALVKEKQSVTPLPLARGEYNVFMQVTGSRLGGLPVGIMLTDKENMPNRQYKEISGGVIHVPSGIVMIADHMTFLMADAEQMERARLAIRRSYISAALVDVTHPGAVINQDVARMAVSTTGLDGGDFQMQYRMKVGHSYRVPFFSYPNGISRSLKMPSNDNARRFGY